MKDINDYINETQQVNESGLLSGFDVSMAVILSSMVSCVVSLGLSITGRMINQWLADKNRLRNRSKRDQSMLALKELTRSIDMSDSDLAMKIMNTPGEWDSITIKELRNELFKKMTKEQQDEFNRLYEEYMHNAAKFNMLK